MTTPFALGRKIEHDPRSLAFPAETAAKLVSVKHLRHAKPFDQKDLGSCCGNAMAGVLMTDPIWNGYWNLTEIDAVSLYSDATKLDSFPGQWPPDDSGTTGLAVAKAAKSRHWISSYRHAFGLDHALAALVIAPVLAGTGWYEDMFHPSSSGELRIGGSVAGGHEYEIEELDVGNQRVWMTNSWGPGWGVHGRAWMSFATLDRLLKEDGDITTVQPSPRS